MKNFITYIIFSFLLALVGCQGENDLASASTEADTGTGGSYARFLTLNNFLYVVDESSVKTFSLDSPAEPVEIDKQEIGQRIESIFHFDGNLFIGSGAGLFIYQIQDDGKPLQLSATEYFDTFDTFACDPVVANEAYAYVTLNSKERVNRPCGGGQIEVDVNVLKIYDIAFLTDPVLINEYEMHAPKGVGLDGDILFVCDDTEGLKILNVSNPLAIEQLYHFNDFVAFDVIPLDGLLLVVGPDNVYQFDYSDIEDVKLIAQIPIGV